MPEGDTVFRQCRILHEALAGGTITGCELRVPRAATADLRDWTVREVVPRGKHLLLRVDPPGMTATTTAGATTAPPSAEPLTLHNHLMMDGIWHVDGAPLRSSDTSANPRATHTARILLTARHADGREVRAVGYDVKQVRLVRTREEAELIGHLGPDLLDPDWSEEHRDLALANLRARPERPIGLALLDQRNLAGIGNIYRCELSFLHRLHPAAPVSAVADLPGMVDLARRLLLLNTSRVVRITTGGMMGRDGDLWVYGRAGRQCRRCRTRIERGDLIEPEIEGSEGRVIFVCPHCQSGGPTSPGDQGAGDLGTAGRDPGTGRGRGPHGPTGRMRPRTRWRP
ncbi:formamidopyrimidine-DNA glycosylase [Brachybacterium endophyticum]|uniref:DNA-(apurinic or apyrimidinic site) lyase n=1 Tax=Brachybacterium endophyticum TaxID=2182385 RepID=A0A2U2RGC0_9MICO|nr:DNA-formamidopyrimidine glycosylase family protein [Brachybacterium endophyticum]PWH04919.1 formamidopyrimidine-DNA glycosylase [Brachybacterium endophyticum]